MGEILGLSVSHHPYIRFKSHMMPGVLLGNIQNGWQDKPHLKEPKNWPRAMQEEWGEDRGASIGKKAQDHQIGVFGKLGAAIEDFRPDFILCIHRDQLGGPESTERPKYWIQAHEKVDVNFYKMGNRLREPYHDEDPDKTDTVPGHRDGALYLAEGLRTAGLDPRVFDEPTASGGLGAHALSGVFHVHWNRRNAWWPIVPLALDPWRFGRQRNNEGLSTLDLSHPNPPLTPKEGFELGRHIARIYQSSPWRVVLLASTAWSGANGTNWQQERVHPDVEADKQLYEEWRNNEFTGWADQFTWEQFEQRAQWELLISIVLAGAMTELGAKVVWSELTSYYILNSSWISTIFERK